MNANQSYEKVHLEIIYESTYHTINSDLIGSVLPQDYSGNACQDTRLKTFLLFLAVTGARSTESLAVRTKDVDFGNLRISLGLKTARRGRDVHRFLIS